MLVGLLLGGATVATVDRVAVRYQDQCRESSARWTLCRLVSIDQATPSLGGPQALEGYTTVRHDEGTVALALGIIGNVELAGVGHTGSARALQGGIVVSGPGQVDQAYALVLLSPQRKGGYDGPVNVTEGGFILFGNHWSIRPDGARLLLCNPQGECRDL